MQAIRSGPFERSLIVSRESVTNPNVPCGMRIQRATAQCRLQNQNHRPPLSLLRVHHARPVERWPLQARQPVIQNGKAPAATWPPPLRPPASAPPLLSPAAPPTLQGESGRKAAILRWRSRCWAAPLPPASHQIPTLPRSSSYPLVKPLQKQNPSMTMLTEDDSEG